MKKHSFAFAILAVLYLAASTPNLHAQCMPTSFFPTGYLPFSNVSFYISAPNEAGDSLFVGQMTLANYQSLSNVPLPNAPNQKYCDTIPLVTGTRYFAYVPTAAERTGNFAAFAGLLVDPVTRVAYPNGQIPLTALPGGSTAPTGVFAWRVPAGEKVFVSTASGGQILKVDGNTGTFQVLTNGPPCPTSGCFSPEGLVVGPDSKLYIADPTNSNIWRIDQSGANLEPVYTKFGAPGFPNFPLCTGAACPNSPEGPSFSSALNSDGNLKGDLYFNTSFTSSGVYRISGAGTTPMDQAFQAPVNVIPGACTTNCFVPGFGEGTAFDNADNLLVTNSPIDPGGKVLTLSPPYTAGTPLVLSSGLTDPVAVALNKATGQLFVSDRSTSKVLAIASNGTTSPYIILGGGCTGPGGPDYMQFDGTGHLYVVVAQDASGACGTVLRVDPPATPDGTPSGTLLVNLSNVSNEALHSNRAIGLALPATQGPSQTITATGGAQEMDFIFDNDVYNFVLKFPAGYLPAGATVTDTPIETSPADWRLRSGNYPGTFIAPVSGYGGDGFVHRLVCMYNGDSCSVTAPPPPPGASYTAFSSWNSQQTNFCESGGAMLKGPVGGNTWVNPTNFCSDTRTDPTAGAGSEDGLSDWPLVYGVTGLSGVTINIVTPPPASPATYSIGQNVLANYSCNPAPSFPSLLGPDIFCIGDVPSGSLIDTSSAGTKTFKVSSVVTTGVAPVQTVNYNVAYSICPLYDQTKAVHFGATIPIKMYLCSATGTDLSSSGIVVHATGLFQMSSSTNDPVIDAGNANPDNDFRFDAGQGPSGGYIFNLKTTGLGSGNWVIQFTVTGDPIPHSLGFGVK